MKEADHAIYKKAVGNVSQLNLVRLPFSSREHLPFEYYQLRNDVILRSLCNTANLEAVEKNVRAAIETLHFKNETRVAPLLASECIEFGQIGREPAIWNEALTRNNSRPVP